MFGLSFLVPAFLVGGLAALVPLVLHLRRREVVPRQPFSDVRFLRAAPMPTRRRRLREWLLLALRVTALLLLALAFARPLLTITDPGSPSTPATVVLVDTSFSMSAPGQGARARTRALDAIDTAPDPQRVGVVAFDDRARVVAPLGTRPAARTAVEALAPGARGTRYGEGVAAASALLGAGGGRIVVVTDRQAVGWRPADGLVSPDVTVTLSDVGSPDGNLAVISIEPVPGATLAVLFRSGAVLDDVLATLAVDDEVLAEVPVTPATGLTTVRFPVVLPEAGVATVSVTDRLGYEVDNRRYRLLDPPAPRVVRIVVGVEDRAPREEADTAFYLERALASGEGLGPFVPAVVRADAFASRTEPADPDDARGVVVLTGVDGLGREGRARLRAFVRGGGGLLVVGEANGLDSLFEGDPALGLGEVVMHAEPVALASQAPRHPIMRGLGSLVGALGQARFARTRSIAAGAGTVLARFGDGQPALVEHTAEAGRILVLGAELDAGATDFARRATFVPFLYETLSYLAAEETRPREFTIGEGPAGTPEAPGVFTMADGRGRSVVNVDARESDPATVTPEEFGASVDRLSRAATLDSRAGATRESGQPLWRGLVALMLVVLVGESVLGRRMA